MLDNSDATGSLLGFAAVQVGRLLGFISVASAMDALILGGMGAAGGWILTHVLNFFKQIIKTRKTKKNETDNQT